MKDTQCLMYNPSPHPTQMGPHISRSMHPVLLFIDKRFFVVSSEIPAGKVKDVTFIGST